MGKDVGRKNECYEINPFPEVRFYGVTNGTQTPNIKSSRRLAYLGIGKIKKLPKNLR